MPLPSLLTLLLVARQCHHPPHPNLQEWIVPNKTGRGLQKGGGPLEGEAGEESCPVNQAEQISDSLASAQISNGITLS